MTALGIGERRGYIIVGVGSRNKKLKEKNGIKNEGNIQVTKQGKRDKAGKKPRREASTG